MPRFCFNLSIIDSYHQITKAVRINFEYRVTSIHKNALSRLPYKEYQISTKMFTLDLLMPDNINRVTQLYKKRMNL